MNGLHIHAGSIVHHQQGHYYDCSQGSVRLRAALRVRRGACQRPDAVPGCLPSLRCRRHGRSESDYCSGFGRTACGGLGCRSQIAGMPVSPPTARGCAGRSIRACPCRSVERESDTWKWWYYVLAGVGIGGYSIWQAYDQHRLKPLGELFLAGLCIAIGIWDFQRKRNKRREGLTAVRSSSVPEGSPWRHWEEHRAGTPG